MILSEVQVCLKYRARSMPIGAHANHAKTIMHPCALNAANLLGDSGKCPGILKSMAAAELASNVYLLSKDPITGPVARKM